MKRINLKTITIFSVSIFLIFSLTSLLIFRSIAKSPFLDIFSAIENTLESENFHIEFYNNDEKATIKADIAFNRNDNTASIYVNALLIDIVSIYNNGECRVLYKSILSKQWLSFQNTEIFNKISTMLISYNHFDNLSDSLENIVLSIFSAFSLEETYNVEESVKALKKMYFNFSLPWVLNRSLGYKTTSEDNHNTISFSFSEKFIVDKFYNYMQKAFKSNEKRDEFLSEWNNSNEQYKDKIVDICIEIKDSILSDISFKHDNKTFRFTITNVGNTIPNIPSQFNS